MHRKGWRLDPAWATYVAHRDMARTARRYQLAQMENMQHEFVIAAQCRAIAGLAEDTNPVGIPAVPGLVN